MLPSDKIFKKLCRVKGLTLPALKGRPITITYAARGRAESDEDDKV
jgi:hypothetical protein